MTTQTLTRPMLDLTATRPVGFGRLVRVEARKMADTLSGRWLLISTTLLTAVVLAVHLAVALGSDVATTYTQFLTTVNIPMAIILPVLGILSVTQEFGQRTALTTFTQVPSRTRVYAAKLVAMLGIAAAAAVTGIVLAAVANTLYGTFGDHAAVWGVGADDLGRYLLVHALGLLGGLAFGALFMSTAPAIVVFFTTTFVATGLFEAGVQIIGGWFADIRPWVDFQAAQEPLADGGVTAIEWAHLGVSSLPWLVLPLAVGMYRALRAEVK